MSSPTETMDRVKMYSKFILGDRLGSVTMSKSDLCRILNVSLSDLNFAIEYEKKCMRGLATLKGSQT